MTATSVSRKDFLGGAVATEVALAIPEQEGFEVRFEDWAVGPANGS